MFCLLVFASIAFPDHDALKQPGVLVREFLYETAPFPECHASTIVETPAGMVAAWFGGTEEKHRDVGIWVARLVNGKWTAPVEAANGVINTTKRYPTWNPVLHQIKDGPLLLFYKVGPTPSTWWGEVKRSKDNGVTWSDAERLPDPIIGPIKNKAITLKDGTILSGCSTEDHGWRLHFERSTDGGRTWKSTGPINEGKLLGVIQPTLLTYPDGRIQALNRNRGKNKIYETWSNDDGKTWSKLEPTMLPNNNSGIDGVTLSDGRQLLVYNHTTTGRSPLNVAVSKDGKVWEAAVVLETEKGEFSYPAVVQAADGKVHITYTWNRKKICHVVLDPMKLELKPIK
jgi:predicted neuraminidase